MPPELRIADGIEYDPSLDILVIHGVRFSPVVLADLTPASGEWSGPMWIRRDLERKTIEISHRNPSEPGVHDDAA